MKSKLNHIVFTKFKTTLQFLRLLPTILREPTSLMDKDSMFVQRFHEIESYNAIRQEYIQTLCKGKRVLHFGFLDAPIFEDKIKSGLLLHTQIQKVASFLYGIDIDEETLKVYRDITQDTDNAIFDIQHAEQFPDFLTNNYDVILLTEVLEHLPYPFEALRGLWKLCQLNPGAQLCVTVPNAMSPTGLYGALHNIELVHPDHYFYFSPYTLKHILQTAGFTNIRLQLYSNPILLSGPSFVREGVIAVCQV